MVLFFAACVFIDDAEHAAFLATLGGGDSGDTDTDTDTDSDTDSGDTGDTGVAPLTGFPSGLVTERASGFATEDELHFGTSVAVVALAADDVRLVASTNHGVMGGDRAWGWSAELAPERGQTVVLLDSGSAAHTSGGRIDTVGAVRDSDSGELHVVTASLGLTAEAWRLRDQSEGSSLGVLEGESALDDFGGVFVDVGGRAGITAPKNACGAAYVVDWVHTAGTRVDVATLYLDDGRKLVPPDGCLDDRFGAAMVTGDFAGDGSRGLVIGAPGARAQSARGAGQAWVLTDLYDAAHEGEVVYVEDAGVRLDGVAADGQLGAALAVWDADQDGTDDLAVAAPKLDEGADSAGAVYVYLEVRGLASGYADVDANIVLRPEVEDAEFGTALAAVGPTRQALAVGAPGWEADAGAVLLFEGEGLTSDTAFAAPRRLDGAPGMRLGTTLAADPGLTGVLAGTPQVTTLDILDSGAAWWWW